MKIRLLIIITLLKHSIIMKMKMNMMKKTMKSKKKMRKVEDLTGKVNSMRIIIILSLMTSLMI